MHLARRVPKYTPRLERCHRPSDYTRVFRHERRADRPSGERRGECEQCEGGTGKPWTRETSVEICVEVKEVLLGLGRLGVASLAVLPAPHPGPIEWLLFLQQTALMSAVGRIWCCGPVWPVRRASGHLACGRGN